MLEPSCLQEAISSRVKTRFLVLVFLNVCGGDWEACFLSLTSSRSRLSLFIGFSYGSLLESLSLPANSLARALSTFSTDSSTARSLLPELDVVKIASLRLHWIQLRKSTLYQPVQSPIVPQELFMAAYHKHILLSITWSWHCLEIISVKVRSWQSRDLDLNACFFLTTKDKLSYQIITCFNHFEITHMC